MSKRKSKPTSKAGDVKAAPTPARTKQTAAATPKTEDARPLVKAKREASKQAAPAAAPRPADRDATPAAPVRTEMPPAAVFHGNRDENGSETAGPETRSEASPEEGSPKEGSPKGSEPGPDVFPAISNVGDYQAKLMEMTQANLQSSLEFVQKLASVRSPFGVPAVFAEFAGRRMALFAKFSKELTEVAVKR